VLPHQLGRKRLAFRRVSWVCFAVRIEVGPVTAKYYYRQAVRFEGEPAKVSSRKGAKPQRGRRGQSWETDFHNAYDGWVDHVL
jgi:hypothetical protein